MATLPRHCRGGVEPGKMFIGRSCVYEKFALLSTEIVYKCTLWLAIQFQAYLYSNNLLEVPWGAIV